VARSRENGRIVEVFGILNRVRTIGKSMTLGSESPALGSGDITLVNRELGVVERLLGEFLVMLLDELVLSSFAMSFGVNVKDMSPVGSLKS